MGHSVGGGRGEAVTVLEGGGTGYSEGRAVLMGGVGRGVLLPRGYRQRELRCSSIGIVRP